MSARISILQEIRRKPSYWFLPLVPLVLVLNSVMPTAHTVLFLLSVAALVPLAVTLSRATESVATRTGDMFGGLLNATLGNLTELVIALAALRAGQLILVKASIVGAIFTKSLFMLGASFLLGGLKFPVQEYEKANARTQAGLMFLASMALLVSSHGSGVLPGCRHDADDRDPPCHASDFQRPLSLVRGSSHACGIAN